MISNPNNLISEMIHEPAPESQSEILIWINDMRTRSEVWFAIRNLKFRSPDQDSEHGLQIIYLPNPLQSPDQNQMIRKSAWTDLNQWLMNLLRSLICDMLSKVPIWIKWFVIHNPIGVFNLHKKTHADWKNLPLFL